MIIFICAITLIAALVYAVLPIAVSEFTNLFLNFKDYADPFLEFLDASKAFGTIGEKLTGLTDKLISGTASLLSVAGSLFGGVFLAVAVLILSFYLTVGQDGVEKLFPPSNDSFRYPSSRAKLATGQALFGITYEKILLSPQHY